MSDREMYELAAKGASIEIQIIEDPEKFGGLTYIHEDGYEWRPTADLTQAFELAQESGISITYSANQLGLTHVLGVRNVTAAPDQIALQIVYFAATIQKLRTGEA